jgi:hypothetical protein
LIPDTVFCEKTETVKSQQGTVGIAGGSENGRDYILIVDQFKNQDNSQ